ncbi:NAD(+) synthase [Pseudacidobacterium ailaaui]|uniref:NAD(+) synthase n=1 Tax=Pseudacidobacterium ailaaui TaxID=1382359 RepID=UPI000A848FE4|nr:NAD(+) synthase [Pseudacidobacterium ailaaui]
MKQTESMTLLSDPLRLDAEAEVQRIESSIREMVFRRLRRKGAVIGVSGGIDSSVVAFLCARALGPERTVLLFTPELDSSNDSLRLGQSVAQALGARAFIEDISPILKGARCYERRDEAIRTVFPEYGQGYKMKIVLPSIHEDSKYSLFSLVVQAPDGTVHKRRLTAEAYLGILASTNFKQRARKMIEYHYADRYQFAVAGTPNRLEYDQGFFVKNGDGAADFKPIAHLYKSQVYQLAEYLGVPEEIRKRPPTTDTYSLEQTQEEFYFSMPLRQFDLCLFGRNHELPPEEIAQCAGLSVSAVERAYQQIDAKRSVTRYLRMEPLLVEPVDECEI